MAHLSEICSLTWSKDKTIALHCPKQMDLWASWVSFYSVEFLFKVNWHSIHGWSNSQSSLAFTYYIWFNWYHLFLQTHTVDRVLKITIWYFCNSSRLHAYNACIFSWNKFCVGVEERVRSQYMCGGCNAYTYLPFKWQDNLCGFLIGSLQVTSNKVDED